MTAHERTYSLPALEQFAAALGCSTRVVPFGHAPLPEQFPGEFAAIVLEWLRSST